MIQFGGSLLLLVGGIGIILAMRYRRDSNTDISALQAENARLRALLDEYHAAFKQYKPEATDELLMRSSILITQLLEQIKNIESGRELDTAITNEALAREDRAKRAMVAALLVLHARGEDIIPVLDAIEEENKT